MKVRVQNVVLSAGLHLGITLTIGVLDSGEEGDDEGQQAGVDAQQRHLGVEFGLPLARLLTETEDREETLTDLIAVLTTKSKQREKKH